MAAVILHMDLHCLGCAKKIRRAIKKIHGVENVRVSPETGLVTVAGSVDASELKRRIESIVTSEVTIVSDGGEEARDYWRRAHLRPPPPRYAPPPQGYPPYYAAVSYGAEEAPDYRRMAPPPQYAAPPQRYPHYAGMVHLAPPHYGAPPQAHQYGGGWHDNPMNRAHARQYVPRRHYMRDEAPVCFKDENPNGCCVMQ